MGEIVIVLMDGSNGRRICIDSEIRTVKTGYPAPAVPGPVCLICEQANVSWFVKSNPPGVSSSNINKLIYYQFIDFG
jgi:hypothetical protein